MIFQPGVGWPSPNRQILLSGCLNSVPTQVAASLISSIVTPRHPYLLPLNPPKPAVAYPNATFMARQPTVRGSPWLRLTYRALGVRLGGSAFPIALP